MKIPSFLFGDFADVNRTCSARIRQYLKDSDWMKLEGTAFIDTSVQKAPVLLDGPSPVFKNGQVFHLFLLQQKLFFPSKSEVLDPDKQDIVFEQLLSSSWGTLSLMGLSGDLWMHHAPERTKRLLKAASEFYTELDAIGMQCSTGSTTLRTIWQLPGGLAFALVKNGFTQKEVKDAVDNGEVNLLLKKYFNY